MHTEDLILIGEITKPQGHRGEVRVRPLTDSQERFSALTEVYLIAPGAPPCLVRVERARQQKGFVVLKLSCCQDMNAAYALVGRQLGVPVEAAIQLPVGTYFQFQIIGLEVYTEEGQALGRV